MDARGGLNFSNVVVLDAWPVVEYYVESDPSAVEVEKLLSGDSTVVVMSSL